jgi:Glycosyltransferases involved in cell wall biogenesis
MLKKLLQKFKYYGLSGVFNAVKNRISPPYNLYLKNEVIPNSVEMNIQIATFAYTPKISIIMPVYKPKIAELDMCIMSIINNSYKNIEICIVDDGSNNGALDNYFRELTKVHPQIINYKKEQKNSGIAATSNIAISNSTGDYLMLIDNDDMILPHTFFEYVKVLQQERYDFIYSDEDMIDENNKRFNPQFKPDWSPHTLLSRMYVNHLSMYKRELVVEAGGFQSEYDGTQDFDLLLRTFDKFEKVYHIPKILYHWRTSENSIAQSIDNKLYIFERAIKALQSYFSKHNLLVDVNAQDKLLMYNVDFPQQIIENLSLFIIYKGQQQNLLSLLEQATKITTIKVIIINTTTENLEIGDNFTVIESKENISLHQIIKKYQATDICCISTEIIEIQLVKLLQNFIGISKLTQTGVVGCTTVNENEIIVQSGYIMTKTIHPVGYGQKYGDTGYYGRNISLYNYSIVSQECFFVKKSILEKVPPIYVGDNLSVQAQIILLQLSILELGYHNVNMGNHFVSVKRVPTINISLSANELLIISEKWQQLYKSDPNYNNNFSENASKLFQLK